MQLCRFERSNAVHPRQQPRFPLAVALLIVILVVTPANLQPQQGQPPTNDSTQGKSTQVAAQTKEKEEASPKGLAAPPYLFRGEFQDLLGDGQTCAPADHVGEKAQAFQAWIQSGVSTLDANVLSLCKTVALLQPKEPVSGIPLSATVLRKDTGKVVNVRYEQPAFYKTHHVTFFNDKLNRFQDLCIGQGKGLANCSSLTDVDLKAVTGRLRVTLLPTEGLKEEPKPKVTALTDEMVVVEFEATVDYRAKLVTIEDTTAKIAVVSRTLPGPHPNLQQPNISFTVMDPNTTKHNFGDRIAERYVVVDLQIKNPSTRKIQLRKSAVWFEADFVAAAVQAPRKGKKGSGPKGIYDVEPAAYPSPCRGISNQQVWLSKEKASEPADCSSQGGPKIFRYGLEHDYPLYPQTFLSVLGTYDDFTSLKRTAFSYFDMIIAVAAGVGGTLVRGPSYLQTVNILSGIALPRGKGIIINEEEEKRLRTQMIQQSFEDLIQVGPQSSMTTKVFLPRRIIEMQSREWVVIDQLRDVHVELEVVSDVIEEVVVKGMIKLGDTQDRVLLALNVPNRREKRPDGLEVWTYGVGRYESVVFSKALKVADFNERTPEDWAKTEEGIWTKQEAREALLGSITPADTRNLHDGGEVWVNPGRLGFNLAFDKKGVLRPGGVGYQLACKKLAALKDISLRDLETKLAEKVLTTEEIQTTIKTKLEAVPGEIEKLKDDAAKRKIKLRETEDFSLPSPDVEGECVTVTVNVADKMVKEVKPSHCP